MNKLRITWKRYLRIRNVVLIFLGYTLVIYLGVRAFMAPVGWDYVAIDLFILMLVAHLEIMHDRVIHMMLTIEDAKEVINNLIKEEENGH